MSEHTPGPWEPVNIAGVWIVGAKDRHLLTKIPAGSVDAEGNARLMAAAPDLLAALEAYVKAQGQMLEKWSEGTGAVKQRLWMNLHTCEDAARAAIAKARGED